MVTLFNLKKILNIPFRMWMWILIQSSVHHSHRVHSKVVHWVNDWTSSFQNFELVQFVQLKDSFNRTNSWMTDPSLLAMMPTSQTLSTLENQTRKQTSNATCNVSSYVWPHCKPASELNSKWQRKQACERSAFDFLQNLLKIWFNILSRLKWNFKNFFLMSRKIFPKISSGFFQVLDILFFWNFQNVINYFLKNP